MKRVICLLLSFILVLSLPVPCEAVTRKTDSGKTSTSATEAKTDVTAKEAVGTYEDGVYDNEMLGIQATFDETWYVATVEERLALVGVLSEAITDESIAKLLEENGSAMDLYAIQENGNSVNLMIQKLDSVVGLLISEQDYVDYTIGEIEPAMEAIEVKNPKIQAITVTFAGEKHPGISIDGTQNGLDFHEKMVVVKAGGYLSIVTAACYGKNVTDDILDLFESK